MELDLCALRQLARSAQPGPWASAEFIVGTTGRNPDGDDDLAWAVAECETQADAAFIAAANPAVVLALIDELDRTRRALVALGDTPPEEPSRSPHAADYAARLTTNGFCTCGWAAAHRVSDETTPTAADWRAWIAAAGSAEKLAASSDGSILLAEWRRQPDAVRDVLSLAAENAALRRVLEAARAVVDAAPGYTAKGGSIWKLDHALDELRAALGAVSASSTTEKPTARVCVCDTYGLASDAECFYDDPCPASSSVGSDG